MDNQHYKQLAVCGYDAVRSIANENPEKIERIFFTKERAKSFGDVSKLLAAKKKIYRIVNDEELEKLSESVHHQGVVAMIKESPDVLLDLETLEQWSKDDMNFIALDCVGNSHNLGAIVRSAAFYGIQNIVISKEDRQAKISTSAYRVAQGGMEFVKIWKVRTMGWLMRSCENKFIRLAADHRAKNLLRGIVSTKKNENPFVVVLGNEETGLSDEVKENCDYLVKITGSGNIESLNVAQAANVFMYEIQNIPIW